MGVHCKLTELGITTMAVKSLAVIVSLSSYVAAEASYGFGSAIHPTGISKTDRSPQGLPGIGYYGKREAEPSYGYGVAIHPSGISKTDRSPQGLPGYGIVGLYGKREAEPSYGYGVAIHPYGISKTDRSPQGLPGYGIGLYGKR